MKRYHLQLPDEIMDAVQSACRAANVKLAELILALLQRELLDKSIVGSRKWRQKDEIARKRAENAELIVARSIRDQDILAARAEGVSLDELAAKHQMTKSGVCKVIKRAEKIPTQGKAGT